MDLFLSIDVFGNRMCVCVCSTWNVFLFLFPSPLSDDIHCRWCNNTSALVCLLRSRLMRRCGSGWFKDVIYFLLRLLLFSFQPLFWYVYIHVYSIYERKRKTSKWKCHRRAFIESNLFLSFSLSVVLYQKEGDVFGLTLATWSIRLWLC